MGAQVHHRFDREAPTRLQPSPRTGDSVVGNLRFFVQSTPHTVSAVVLNDAVSVGFDKGLDGMTNIANTISRPRLIDALVQTAPGAFEQLVDLRRGRTDRDGDCTVAHVAIQGCTAVDAHHVSVLKDTFPRNAVNNLMVNRYAKCCRKHLGANLVPLEGRNGTGVSNALLSPSIKLDGRHPWLDGVENFFVNIGDDLASKAHEFNFCSGLSYDHNVPGSVARPPTRSKVLARKHGDRHGVAVLSLDPRNRLRLHYVILFLFIGAAGNFLPIWFKHIGWDEIEIGWQGAINYSCLCFFPIAWGHLTDLWGRPTKVLRLLSFCCLLAFLPFILTEDVRWLLLATLGFFAFRTGMLTATDGMTLNFLAREGGDYGRIRLWGSLGFIAGGFILGFIVTELGRDVIPLVLEGILILGFGAVLLLRPVPLENKREEAVLHAIFRLLKRPHLRAFYAVAFMSRVASQGLYIFLPIHLMNLGVQDAWVPLYWTVGVASEVVLLHYAERLFQGRRRRNVLILCFLLATVQHAVTAFITEAEWLLPIMLLHGFSFGVWFYTSVTWLGDAVDERDRARAQGLFHTLGFGFGGVLSSAGAGFLYTLGEGVLLFGVAAALNLLTAILAYCWIRVPAEAPS